MLLNDIIKTVFLRLNAQKIPVTPNMYKKYFCEEAKKRGIYTEDCEYMADDELKRLVELLQDTLEPSIGNYYSNNAQLIQNKLAHSPQLLVDTHLQEEIFSLSQERKNIDRQIIMEKTAQLTAILSNITKSLASSLNASKDGNFNIKNIKNEIDRLDVAGFESDQALKDLKSQFLTIADSIQNETDALSQVLSDESQKVCSLEEKIQKLEQQLHEAKKQSNTDFLTQALTRKAFDEELNSLEKDFVHNNKDYSVIFFDLDHFKSINDTYGHDAGDKVLATFSKLLLKEFDQFGIVARYGGEEFVALCPDKSLEQCYEKAQSIRTILHKANFIYDEQKIKVTYSGGISQRSAQKNIDSMLKYADKLLYQAKNNGRDTIETLLN